MTTGSDPKRKDWSWVLERPCPECRLDTRAILPTQIPAILRENATAWEEALAAVPDPATRPEPGTWSAVEYACHVRDLMVLCYSRVDLMLTQDDPVFANWDQDEAVVAGRYGAQPPGRIAGELAEAAATAAERLERIPPDQWQRPGRRSDGVRYTVETFGRNLTHEAVHHLHDVVHSTGPRPTGGIDEPATVTLTDCSGHPAPDSVDAWPKN